MRVRVEFVPRDLWVGAYWKPGHLWLCLLPCLPIHLDWERVELMFWAHPRGESLVGSELAVWVNGVALLQEGYDWWVYQSTVQFDRPYYAGELRVKDLTRGEVFTA